MKIIVLVSAAALFALSQATFACGLEGSATRTDGSKVDGTGGRVSTSWNGNDVYPRNGHYQLDLGNSACGEKVTVYVSGNEMGRYRLPDSGYLRFDYTLKGTSDYPVR